MNFLKASPILLLIGITILAAPRFVDLTPSPSPQNDVLAAAYAADRLTQIAVLRELAAQPFDGATDEGRRQAGEWWTAARFRGRASDFGGFTDAIADSIAANSEGDLAARLEGGK